MLLFLDPGREGGGAPAAPHFQIRHCYHMLWSCLPFLIQHFFPSFPKLNCLNIIQNCQNIDNWVDYIKKWNESGFRPPLCTYRLNWARRTSWGWWDDWDDTVLQTQDSKFEPWRSEAEHATSRSRRLPTILTFTRGWGRNIFCFFETAETGNRTPSSGVKGSGANHYPRAPARVDYILVDKCFFFFSNRSLLFFKILDQPFVLNYKETQNG